MKQGWSLAWLVTVLVFTAIEPGATKDADAPDCGCFLTNGSNSAYYSKHMFYDFRSLSDYAGVPEILKESGRAASAPPSSDYFESDEWTSTWSLQSWDNNVGAGKLSLGETVLMVNSPSNVFIESNDDKDADSETFMTMRTKRLPKFQSAAEIESTNEYHFVSVRMRARTVGSPGAVTAMFTYKDAKDLADIQEADIEFLTSGDRRMIQYTNQPSYDDDGNNFPEATRNATMPGKLDWTEWHVHRLDWTSERCTWYVDGDETATISFQTPKDASQIIFNAWSDGGSWSGNMTEYDEAYLQIQWIEMVYNQTSAESGKREDSKCDTVCSIDKVDRAGEVKKLWDSSASPNGNLLTGSWVPVLAWVILFMGGFLTVS